MDHEQLAAQSVPTMYFIGVTTRQSSIMRIFPVWSDILGDLFEYLDPYAELCGEVSSISKREGQLEGHARDPISSGLAWMALVGPGYTALRRIRQQCQM